MTAASDTDGRPELRLIREDAGRTQGDLFTTADIPQAATKANGELLQWLTTAEQLATVDDLLAWEHHNQGKGTCIKGCGYRAPVGLRPGCRVWCHRCGVHTVASARDIATGHTPGPVIFQQSEHEKGD